MKKSAAIGIVMGVVASAAAFGQIGGVTSGDPRVKRLLDAIGYKYSITSKHDFKLLFEVAEGRSHLVFINSNTSRYEGFEIREIWAVGYHSETMLTAEKMRILLENSEASKLGGWGLTTVDGKDFATFTVKVAAELSKDDLKSLIQLVTRSADGMEKKLTGTDDL